MSEERKQNLLTAIDRLKTFISKDAPDPIVGFALVTTFKHLAGIVGTKYVADAMALHLMGGLGEMTGRCHACGKKDIIEHGLCEACNKEVDEFSPPTPRDQ